MEQSRGTSCLPGSLCTAARVHRHQHVWIATFILLNSYARDDNVARQKDNDTHDESNQAHIQSNHGHDAQPTRHSNSNVQIIPTPANTHSALQHHTFPPTVRSSDTSTTSLISPLLCPRSQSCAVTVFACVWDLPSCAAALCTCSVQAGRLAAGTRSGRECLRSWPVRGRGRRRR